MFAQLRSFQRDGRVSVNNLKPTLVRQPVHARQQLQTVGVFPLRIIIGKVHTKIAFAQRAQNRVGECVRQHVAIRMSFGAAIGGDPYAAKDQRTPFGQLMRVVTDIDTKHNCRGRACPCPFTRLIEPCAGRDKPCPYNRRIASANTKSSAPVILIFRAAPSTAIISLPRRSTSRLSSVTSIPAPSTSSSCS